MPSTGPASRPNQGPCTSPPEATCSLQRIPLAVRGQALQLRHHVPEEGLVEPGSLPEMP